MVQSLSGTTGQLLTMLHTTRLLDRHHLSLARPLIKQIGATGTTPHKTVLILPTNPAQTVPFVVNSKAQENLPILRTQTIDLSISNIRSLGFRVTLVPSSKKLIALYTRSV
jgi:hypothetical protein